jgi:transcriptional regulator with XRE-family HTH domain
MPQVEQMKKPREMIIEWIDQILERKKWTGTDLARKAGLAPSTILRLLNDPDHSFVPTLRTLQKIADGSGYPLPKRVTDVVGSKAAELEEDTEVRRKTRSERFAQVPLKHVSSLPSSLQSASTPDRETFVHVPQQLENDETCFGFYMPDNSYDPWMKSGALMFATKRRDPAPGDVILITDKTGKSRIRVLMDINEDGLKLSKSMPIKEDEKMGFDDIQEIAIVAVSFRF